MVKINIKDIEELTKKLIKEGDISFEEAQAIVDFTKKNEYELKLKPVYRTQEDREISKVLSLWFRVVKNKFPVYGNYMHTIPLNISMEKDLRGYEPFGSMFQCLKKLPFPYGVRYVDWTCFDVPGCEKEDGVGRISFEYAGEIMHFPELCKKINNMKNVFHVFHGDACASLRDSVGLGKSGEKYKKSVLYQASVVRMAVSMSFPTVYTSSRSEKRLLMYPSDIDKISFLLEFTPDDLVRRAYKEGYLNNQEARKLLEGEWVYVGSPAVICDAFPLYCMEFLGRKEPEEDGWIDIIR